MKGAYVIPPVNAQAINTQRARYGIEESMLIYSSVPEVPPAAYNPATPYALGAEASSGTVGGVIKVYRSLQAGNTGHPLTDGLWWAWAGDTYAAWAAATAYAAGDLVLRPTTHQVYRRVTPGTTAQLPEEDATGVNWVRVGVTNRWAMFDMLVATPTVAAAPLVVRLAPGRISAAALIKASGGAVEFDLHEGETHIWNPDPQPLDTTPISSWEDYFFAGFAVRSNLLRLDVPSYAAGVLTVTVQGSGSITLQKLVVGTAQLLGDTKKGPRIRSKAFSELKRDAYGELEDIVNPKSVEQVSQSMYAPKSIVLRAKAALDAAKFTPCVFAGLGHETDEYAELLTLLGVCIDNEVDLTQVTECEINAEIEGV